VQNKNSEEEIILEKTRRGMILALLLGIVGLFLSGCAFVHPPIYVDPAAFSRDIDKIYVAPVIDVRTDKSSDFNADDIANLRALAVKGLENHGYNARLLSSWSADRQPSDQDLFDMNVEELCKIVPPEAMVFLTITVNDVNSSYRVLSSNYTINGMVAAVGCEQKKEIWKSAASGSYGGSGIIDAAVAMIRRKTRAQSAMMDKVFSSFPDRSKK
jgi:hypothetical protein